MYHVLCICNGHLISTFSKRDCVMDKFNCSENAKEMYIDAVNLEMNMEIKDMAMSQDCNSAAGFQISVLTIFASFMLFFC